MAADPRSQSAAREGRSTLSAAFMRAIADPIQRMPAIHQVHGRALERNRRFHAQLKDGRCGEIGDQEENQEPGRRVAVTGWDWNFRHVTGLLGRTARRSFSDINENLIFLSTKTGFQRRRVGNRRNRTVFSVRAGRSVLNLRPGARPSGACLRCTHGWPNDMQPRPTKKPQRRALRLVSGDGGDHAARDTSTSSTCF